MSTPREVRPHMDEGKIKELFDVSNYEPDTSGRKEEASIVPEATDISEEKFQDYEAEGYLPEESFSDIYPLERDIRHDLPTKKGVLRDALISGVDGGKTRIERVQLHYLVSVGVGYQLPYTTPKRKDDERLTQWWSGAYFVIDDRLLDESLLGIEPNEGMGVTYNNVKNRQTCVVRYNETEEGSRRSSVSGQSLGQLAKLGDYTEIRTLDRTIDQMSETPDYDRKLIIRDGPLFPTSSNLEQSTDQRFGIDKYRDIIEKARRNDIGFLSFVKRVSSARMFTAAMKEEFDERGIEGYDHLQSDGALFYRLLDVGQRSKWMRTSFRGYTPSESDISSEYQAVMAYFRPREKEIWRVEMPHWMFDEYLETEELDALIHALFKDGTGPPRVINLADRNAGISREQEAYYQKTLDRAFNNKLYPPYQG